MPRKKMSKFLITDRRSNDRPHCLKYVIDADASHPTGHDQAKAVIKKGVIVSHCKNQITLKKNETTIADTQPWITRAMPYV